MITFKQIQNIVTNPKIIKLGMLFIIVFLIFLLVHQCERNSDIKNNAKNEITRLKNNLEASDDTIKNYKDKWGNSIGEIQGLTLTLDELKSKDNTIIIEKNKKPVTIIEYRTNIIEKFTKVPIYIRDTVIIQDSSKFDSSVMFEINDTFGLSNRNISVAIPYTIDSTIFFGNANVNLEQNIWLKAAIYKDQKTNKVYVKLESDYPGVTFNNAEGILIDNSSKEYKKFQMKNRKSFGIGINLGIGYDPLHNNVAPYIGIGISYTPKFLQW